MPELVHNSAAKTSLFGHSFGISLSLTRSASFKLAYRPFNCRSATLSTSHLLCHSLHRIALSHAPTLDHTRRCNFFPCRSLSDHHYKPLPSASTWTSAYASGSVTATLFRHLSSKLAWTATSISDLHPALQQFVRNSNLCIHHGRLVVRQSLQSGTSLLLISIVPSSLRRLVFNVSHGTPSAATLEFTKLFSVFKCTSSGLVVIKTLSIESKNAHTAFSSTKASVVTAKSFSVGLSPLQYSSYTVTSGAPDPLSPNLVPLISFLLCVISRNLM